MEGRTYPPVSRVLTLKIWHPRCWTLDVTKEISGLELVANTISNSPAHVAADILAIGSQEVLNSLLKWLDGDSRIIHRYVLDSNPRRRTLRLFIKYSARDSILRTMLSHNMAPIEPVRIVGGYEYWTVYTPHDDFANALHSDPRLSECEITALSAHDLGLRKKRRERKDPDLLTRRQLDIALKALEMGYYSWPRRVTAQELARMLGLSATTVLEHLRKSESKIVRSFLLRVLEEEEFRD
jgi:predicted DNA binding protein